MEPIKPGDKVLIALDVLDITTEDGPPNEDGIYLKAGALKLGFSDDLTDDLYITSGPKQVMPMSSWHVAPAPTDTLRAVIDAFRLQVEEVEAWNAVREAESSGTDEEAESLADAANQVSISAREVLDDWSIEKIDALRAALDAPPVALTTAGMIELVVHEVCPTCKGTGEFECVLGSLGSMIVPCHECDEETRTVPRVLATFADAAALREMIDSALFVFGGMDSHIMTESMGEEVAGTIMDGLGVTEPPQAPAQTP